MTAELKQVKQCVILSGKGGTGKTSICASLMHLLSEQVPGVFVDADVDASNLSLVTGAIPQETYPFSSSKLAIIDPENCSGCGKCFEVCRFNAVKIPMDAGGTYQVIDVLCDGCGACVHQCPEDTINLELQQDGEWYHAISAYGHLFHAELFPAAENSGKLVAELKKQAVKYAEDHQIPLILIDGPPGIGCPVISASTGADLALLVAEPGVSGQHDLERIIQTLEHFNIPIMVCINKSDLYPAGSETIRKSVKSRGYQIIGEIPFDPAIPRAMVQALPITSYEPDNPVSLEIIKIKEVLIKTLFSEKS